VRGIPRRQRGALPAVLRVSDARPRHLPTSRGLLRAALNWRYLVWPATVVLLVANAVMVALSGALIVAGSDALDFEVYRVMAERYPLGTMYESHDWWYQPRYSPVAVVPLSIVAWLGQDVWRLMHFAALIGLPGWTRLVALGTYPFWLDVHAGNVLIVVTVAAYWAVRGNRWGIAATLLLALLIPRPMMLPIVVWVLWKHPAWRWGFAVLFGVHLVAVAATGYASDWIAILLTATEGGSGVGSFLNAAPSAFMGLWWMALAVPAAIWALSRGASRDGRTAPPALLAAALLLDLAGRPVASTLPRVTHGAGHCATGARLPSAQLIRAGRRVWTHPPGRFVRHPPAVTPGRSLCPNRRRREAGRGRQARCRLGRHPRVRE